MKAKLTFTVPVFWNVNNNSLAFNCNVQGCHTRPGDVLLFTPDFSLNENTFQGEIRWVNAPHFVGLNSGAKITYIIPATGKVVAVGEIL